jgi:hypothetical protein
VASFAILIFCRLELTMFQSQLSMPMTRQLPLFEMTRKNVECLVQCELTCHSRVAIIPPETEYATLPPRNPDGHLHPDCYWYGTIVDLRASPVCNDDGNPSELWAKVSWFYTQQHIHEVKLSKKLKKKLLDLL